MQVMMTTINELSKNCFEHLGNTLRQRSKPLFSTTFRTPEELKKELEKFYIGFEDIQVSDSGFLLHPLLKEQIRKGIKCYFINHPSVMSGVLELSSYPVITTSTQYSSTYPYNLEGFRLDLYITTKEMEEIYKDIELFAKASKILIKKVNLSSIQLNTISFFNLPSKFHIMFEAFIVSNVKDLIKYRENNYLFISTSSLLKHFSEFMLKDKTLEVYLSSIPSNTYLTFKNSDLQYARIS